MRVKQNLEEANKDLQFANGNLQGANADLQAKIERSENERLRMEAEARDSGDQLREMAEKVFQLLERLKLAELGKTKAMEALKKKEQDIVALQKKNARLIKESTEEGRARVKAELDVKVLQDQVRNHKKQNSQLAQKAKDEAEAKVKAQEEVDQLTEQAKATESRLSFLLNKVQSDEEAKVVLIEDRKKLEAQVLTLSQKAEELHHKLAETSESNRMITQAMRLKQEELNSLSLKYEALVKESENKFNYEEGPPAAGTGGVDGARPGGPDDIENVRMNEGRGRFYVEAKTVGGGSLLVLRGRKPIYKEWLDKQGANDFLKKAQKTNRFRDLMVEKVGALYGLLMVDEEERNGILEQLQDRDKQIEHLQKKLVYVQNGLATEEDAKRRMLLRYVHAVKEHAMASNDGVGGALQLPESNISDEEVHALSALLRNNMHIDELNLRGNVITDDGARALAAVLAGRCGLKVVDLRGNKISKGTIRTMAEALERAERVRHVYVHAGGKIEALGTGKWAANSTTGGASGLISAAQDAKMAVTVETVCIVDMRDNEPDANPNSLNANSMMASTFSSTSEGGAGNANSGYMPTMQLQQIVPPPRSAGGGNRPNPSTVSPERMGKKSSKVSSMVRSLNRIDRDSADDSDFERRKTGPKRQDAFATAKEAAWIGRSGGMQSFGLENVKKGRRDQLPPLSHDGGEGQVRLDSLWINI
jgi:myosin protein heavy chain